MTQVKFFLNQEVAKLEQDIKYQSIGNKYLSFLAFSAMVIYEKKE